MHPLAPRQTRGSSRLSPRKKQREKEPKKNARTILPSVHETFKKTAAFTARASAFFTLELIVGKGDKRPICR